jgi:hypothetical protein
VAQERSVNGRFGSVRSAGMRTVLKIVWKAEITSLEYEFGPVG